MSIGSPTQSAAGPEAVSRVLDIDGMTCASCVGRVEKALRRVDGVSDATVNLAAETATVRFEPGAVEVQRLVEAVTKAGYVGTPRSLPKAPTAPTGSDEAAPAASARAEGSDPALTGLKRRWQVALIAAGVLMAAMYVPIYPDAMDWLMPAMLVVASVVQFWAGADIYRSAWQAARHRSTTMNTLVALGTVV
ncbi:MAG TPA: cation transporter, partial [Microlunatus sp.]